MDFKLHSEYSPTGDQPQAIEVLTDGVLSGKKAQVLLGVTGSGKTYTMANVIARVNRPTLVLAHNKTLAAQLASEFREFFPENAVGYFVSYYDYYQPEAYIASSDTYIEKDAAINDEIDRMRHSATAWLSERRDVIIVASVSCIYSMGDPQEYEGMSVSLREGMELSREELLRQLVMIQYERNDFELQRCCFRVRGDIVDIMPAGSDKHVVRVEFFGDEIDRISHVDPVTQTVVEHLNHVMIFPASHYVTNPEAMERGIAQIEKDLEKRIAEFKAGGRAIEAERIEQRTRYDIEMMREVGYCQGIENYSRYFDGRKEGDAPFTLLDYFPDDFLLFIDESHVTVPQVHAMFNGDRARKTSLVDFGFRLPSAFDNRPLRFHEFEKKIGQVIFTSATPGPYETERAEQVVEQIIRPTGLLDPEVLVRPATNQVDDLIGEITKEVAAKRRVLVTTLTKRMAEDLTRYLKQLDIKVTYMHSDVDTLDRIRILRELRLGEHDVLVGINLLREGLDLPEVGLVAILDADKEGFLRSETALVQTIGRAARNVDGRVIMYADTLTDSMMKAIGETNRRRAIQMEYNRVHGITPRSIQKAVREIMEVARPAQPGETAVPVMTDEEKELAISHLEEQMLDAAGRLDFEQAAKLRDQILVLKGEKPQSAVTEPVKRTRTRNRARKK